MARERKKIAGRKGALGKGALDVSMETSFTKPLAKLSARSHSQDQFHAFIRALARELARQDHARDTD